MEGAFQVKIIRSPRRKKTVSARVDGQLMFVSAPLGIPQQSLDTMIRDFQVRFQRRRLKKELNNRADLSQAAEGLNQRYFGGALKIQSIEYVTNQTAKYGCCNHQRARILLSHVLSQMPRWVRDYVIVHEMAHLVEPNHSHEFWNLVARYPLAERAKGFLLAKGYDIAIDESGREENLDNELPPTLSVD